jgi:fibronectin type 3 domain-containing protein
MIFNAGCRPRKFAGVFFLCVALVTFFQLAARANQSALLTWNPSPQTNVTGYKIYSGPASHSYSSVVTVDNVTNATLSGLVPGKTYYYAATAVDAAGNESTFSNEASYVVPAPVATLTAAVHAAGRFSFTVSGSAGQQYVVQASTNLLAWDSLQTNAAPFVFVDTHAGEFNRRFYRTTCFAP